LSLGVSGSPVVLVASNPVLLARIWPLAIICSGVQRLRCKSCYVPIDAASKPVCCFFGSFFDEVGFSFKLQARHSFQRRVVASFSSDKGDWEIYARTRM
jgi:hypothetical protein